jgi:glucose/arabinose dehydrogenase
MTRPLALALASAALLSPASADWKEYFDFEKIDTPPGIDDQVGGIDFLPDGRLAAVFHRGEAMILDPGTGKWSLFANGLQEPLGVIADADGSLVVMQRAELTRLSDTNGDGRADHYQTLCDGFGMTGNYHEFAFGPARGPDGHFYFALGLASNGAAIRPEIRGPFSEIGRLTRDEMTEPDKWNALKGRAGRMYSRVPYRGWVIRVAPDGSSAEPYASGFRSPDGIGFDAQGRLLVTDNQGDWRATSPLYSVKKGGFHGNPASLVWEKDWDGRDPNLIPAAELATMHHQPAGYFAQGELANSPTQPIASPPGSLPETLVGQTIIGEMNQPTLIRVLDDEVEGIHQVALLPFLDKSPLGNGNHRLAFAPDGSLYVGKTALSWAGSRGLVRVKWNGTPFPALERINALPSGFALRFTQAIDPATVSGIKIQSHTYRYHSGYGSPKVDEKELPLRTTNLQSDGFTLTLDCGTLEEGFLHLIDLSTVRTREGKSLLGDRAWYHVVKKPH